MRRIQYSPPSEIAPYFQQYPFAYSLESHDGPVITTVNRIRVFLAQVFEIHDASRRLIEAIIHDIWGKLLGEVIDSETNIARVCHFHVWAFRHRVEIALRRGEIQR